MKRNKNESMEEFLQVGAIANTHGIAGEVKVFPMTDDIKRFKKLKEVYLDTGKERKLLHVVSCKFVKNQPVLRFKEFSNINEVEMYKKKKACLLQEIRQYLLKKTNTLSQI